VVRQLSSALAMANISAADAALRDVINQTMYMRIADRFDIKLPFIKWAIERKLGAPLSGRVDWRFNGQDYVYAVYAGDTLYAPKGKLAELKLLSETPD
jgi:hypothetical protein